MDQAVHQDPLDQDCQLCLPGPLHRVNQRHLLGLQVLEVLQDQGHQAVQVDQACQAGPTDLLGRLGQAGHWGRPCLLFQAGLGNQDCRAFQWGQVVAVVLSRLMLYLHKVLAGNSSQDIHIVRTERDLCHPNSLEHIASVRSIFRSADWRQKGSTQAAWRLLPRPARAFEHQSDQEFKVPPKGCKIL